MGKGSPHRRFSVQGGKLPTLIGAENTFTFQNMNIERGLLWNQEPAISRGGQLNYTMDPLTFAFSWNDGFYSDRFTWLSGSLTYTLDSSNSFVLAAGGNYAHTTKATLATPLFQNNSTLVTLVYTYNAAPWTITPYFQFTNVPGNSSPPFNLVCQYIWRCDIGKLLFRRRCASARLQHPNPFRIHIIDGQPSERCAKSPVRPWQ